MSQSTSCNGERGSLCADNFDNSVFAYGWATRESNWLELLSTALKADGSERDKAMFILEH